MYKKFKKALKMLLPKSTRRSIANAYHYLETLTANVVLGFPGRTLKIIGVTGTSGKSTVTAMVGHIFNKVGRKTAYFSTTNAFWGGRVHANTSTLTTETPMNLYRRIKEVERSADEYLVVESSAHAVVQHRLAFIRYIGGVFTNLSHDHLDYFGTMDRYAAAKRGLFEMIGKRRGWGVFTKNDEHSKMMQAPIDEQQRLTYDINSGDVRGENITEKNGATSFDVHYQGKAAPVKLRLTGTFNVENALAAIGCALQEGIGLAEATKALDSFEGVKGRMERFETKKGAHVLVDFAHTPDAFELVFSDLQKHTDGKIIAVFGGYGNRDHSIRAPFGRIAATFADHIILTEDTVYDEKVSDINQDIKKGIAEVASFGGEVEEIEAREAAITRAVSIAKKGDVVALLGKGHETTIPRVGGDKPWDEIAEVKKAIAAQ